MGFSWFFNNLTYFNEQFSRLFLGGKWQNIHPYYWIIFTEIWDIFRWKHVYLFVYLVKTLRPLSTKNVLLFQRIIIILNIFEKGEYVMTFLWFLLSFPADLHKLDDFFVPFNSLSVLSWKTKQIFQFITLNGMIFTFLKLNMESALDIDIILCEFKENCWQKQPSVL